MVAARTAATINPLSPFGIESTTNVGKIESGTANGRAWYNTYNPIPIIRKSVN